MRTIEQDSSAAVQSQQASTPAAPSPPVIQPIFDKEFPGPGRGGGVQAKLLFDASSTRLLVCTVESRATLPHPRVIGSYIGCVMLAVCFVLTVRTARRMYTRPQQRGRLYCRRCNYELGVPGKAPHLPCAECGADARSARPTAGRSFQSRFARLLAFAAIGFPTSFALVWFGVERRTLGELTWPVENLQRLYAAWPLMPVRTPIDMVQRVRVITLLPDGKSTRVEPLRVCIESLAPPVISTDGNTLAWIDANSGGLQTLSTMDLQTGTRTDRSLPKSPSDALRVIGIRNDGRTAILVDTAPKMKVIDGKPSPSIIEKVFVNLYVWSGQGDLKQLHSLTFDPATASGVAGGWPGLSSAFLDGPVPMWAVTASVDRGLRDVFYGTFSERTRSPVVFPNWRTVESPAQFRGPNTLVFANGEDVSLRDGLLSRYATAELNLAPKTYAESLYLQKEMVQLAQLAMPAKVHIWSRTAVSPDGRYAAADYRHPIDTPFGPFGVLIWRLPDPSANPSVPAPAPSTNPAR